MINQQMDEAANDVLDSSMFNFSTLKLEKYDFLGSAGNDNLDFQISIEDGQSGRNVQKSIQNTEKNYNQIDSSESNLYLLDKSTSSNCGIRMIRSSGRNLKQVDYKEPKILNYESDYSKESDYSDEFDSKDSNAFTDLESDVEESDERSFKKICSKREKEIVDKNIDENIDENIDGQVQEMENDSDQSTGRNEIKRWLRMNYEKSNKSEDVVIKLGLRRKLFSFLKSIKRKPIDRRELADLLTSTFGQMTHSNRFFEEPQSRMFHCYSFFKEKKIYLKITDENSTASQEELAIAIRKFLRENYLKTYKTNIIKQIEIIDDVAAYLKNQFKISSFENQTIGHLIESTFEVSAQLEEDSNENVFYNHLKRRNDLDNASEREKIIKNWLMDNYYVTSKQQLIKLDEISSKLSIYLENLGERRVTSKKIDVFVQEVFGDLPITEKQDNDGEKTSFFYRFLCARGIGDQVKEDEITNIYEDKRYAACCEWLKKNYKRTNYKKDCIKKCALWHKCNDYLASQNKDWDFLDISKFGILLNSTFKHLPSVTINSRKNGQFSAYGCLKEISSDDETIISEDENEDDTEGSISESLKGYELIIKYLKSNYYKTENRFDLVGLNRLNDRLSEYLKQRNKKLLDVRHVSKILRHVFDFKEQFILRNKITNSSREKAYGLRFYAYLKRIKQNEDDDSSEDEIANNFSKKIERNQLIEKHLMDSYERTDNEDDLVQATKISGKFNCIMKSLGKDPEKNYSEFGRFLTKVFGKLPQIRIHNKKTRSFLIYYRFLREKNSSQEKEVINKRVQKLIITEDEKIVVNFLKNNYIRTQDKSDLIGRELILDAVNAHLKNKASQSNLNQSRLGMLIKHVFGDGLPRLRRTESNKKIAYYGFLKEKT